MPQATLLTNPAIAPEPAQFTHIVTLWNRRTDDERSLRVETCSGRFTDVMREITRLKVVHGLQGYEVFEALDCNPAPF